MDNLRVAGTVRDGRKQLSRHDSYVCSWMMHRFAQRFANHAGASGPIGWQSIQTIFWIAVIITSGCQGTSVAKRSIKALPQIGGTSTGKSVIDDTVARAASMVPVLRLAAHQTSQPAGLNSPSGLSSPDELNSTVGPSSSTGLQNASSPIDQPLGLELGDETVSLLSEVEQTIASHTNPATVVPELPPLVLATPPMNSSQRPSVFRDMTEDELLATAFSTPSVLRQLGAQVLQNPAAVTTRFDRAIASADPLFGPQAALAEFDTQIAANLNTANNDRVFNNTIIGGSVQELTQDLATSQLSAQRRSIYGTTFSAGIDHQYDNNNRGGNRFRNYYETQWQASVRQPLLAGAGRQFNLIAGPNARPGFNFSNGILLANLNVRVTQADFKIQLRQYVVDVYQIYWRLQQQYAQYQSLVDAEKLAYETWQSVRARRDANLAGGEAAKEAQARSRYYGFGRQIQSLLGGDGGQDGLYATERQMRRAIGIELVDGTLLRPVDPPPVAEFTFDYDSLLAETAIHRTELNRQSLRVRQQELRLIASKNFLLPQLDVIGRYRMRGFGDDLTGGGERFASAYRDLFSFDHQEFEFGLEFGVAAGRRQAKAAVRHEMLRLQKERSIYQQSQQEIELQVAGAHAEVASSYAAMTVSQLQTEASQDRLDASLAQFDADKIRIEFLLDAQEELLRARTQYAADASRYAVSLINLSALSGRLLADLGIGCEGGCEATCDQSVR